MLDPRRSLLMHASDSPELPRVPELTDLYAHGWRPRQGELMMIAGRSGSGKSTFALFYTAKLGLPVLYFSSDMTAAQVNYKLAAASLMEDMEDVEREWRDDEDSHDRILDSLADLKFMFSYGGITYKKIDDTLDAYVELFDSWPAVIVIDNLMDVEGCESDYTEQQAAMQYIHEMKSNTGSTVIVLHHATDKGYEVSSDPYAPPARKEIKNGMSEKPEQVLTVGLNGNTNEFKVANVKQRLGRSDPTGRSYATLLAIPAQSRYESARPTVYPMYHAVEGD